jgi:hypothetical protein
MGFDEKMTYSDDAKQYDGGEYDYEESSAKGMGGERSVVTLIMITQRTRVTISEYWIERHVLQVNLSLESGLSLFQIELEKKQYAQSWFIYASLLSSAFVVKKRRQRGRENKIKRVQRETKFCSIF